MKGTVYKSTGSWYSVKDDEGRFRNARVKGLMKTEGITSTNPIAVGDEVELNVEEGEESVMITAVLDRRNYINRQSPRHKHQHHIIASNLDQSLLIATLKDPRTSQGFIDRFLVACEMYHIPAVIVFNKSDLHKKKENDLLAYYSSVYEEIGYKILRTSVLKNEGIESLKEILKDRTSLISGHSGVGKSSIINAVLPGADIKTKDVSGWSGKGMHTTTFAEMYDLPYGGRLIDTPGMREFGLVDVSREELSGYFPEMRMLLQNCQFNNCKHINEPGCAIKEAVEKGAIAEDRYVSYYNILESLSEQGWR